jgi:hypothetical protein
LQEDHRQRLERAALTIVGFAQVLPERPFGLAFLQLENLRFEAARDTDHFDLAGRRRHRRNIRT